jgi:hypothetical protein
MTEKQPPQWENDALSKFFRDAEYNDRVTAVNYPDVFRLLRFVQETFELAEQAVETARCTGRPIPQFLLVRTHSAFLASTRLAMSGQSFEAQIVLRSAVESAWYALHIASDPVRSERAEVWLRRNDDACATVKCRNEFTVSKVRASHEALDPQGARELQGLYETLIDFGAHPNQLGVLGSVIRAEDEIKIDHQVGILQPEPLRMMMAVRLGVAVAVGTLRAFGAIYPERFELSGLYEKLGRIVADLNTVFSQFATKTGRFKRSLHWSSPRGGPCDDAR